VAGVTLGARRWGPRVGGWLTALPLVAGPTLFFLAMEQGDAFAGAAALSTLVGLIAVAAFGVAYGWVAVRHRWPLSLALGWAAFIGATVLLQTVRWTPPFALGATLAAFFVATRVLPPAREQASPPASPAWDLPLRMLGTLAVVLTVTHVADRLGPRWSGAVTPFPVALAVLLVFAHAQQGAPLAIRLLHGFFSRDVGLRIVLSRRRARDGAARTVARIFARAARAAHGARARAVANDARSDL